MAIRLSVCIPTYNRGAYIGETLASIISQATDEIEIVVSDNGSADNTEDVVRDFQQRFPRIIYFRWNQNMGADRNFLKVIELANGDYCWFMGSDDIVESGGIEAVLGALSSNENLAGISVNRFAYTVDMKERRPERAVSGGKLKVDHLFTDANAAFIMLGDYLGYLPAQIIDRRLWNDVIAENDPSPYFNAYVHIFVIAKMLLKRPRWLYLAKRCVGWRSDNDSFLTEGAYKRLALDVQGYEKIARDVYGSESKPYRELMKTVSGVHVRYAIIGAKLKGAPMGFFIKALRLCAGTYFRYPSFWLQTFPLFFVPRIAIVFARFLYRQTIKPIRTRRLSS